LFGPTGLVAAKKSTLIAMAKPACSARTTTRRILLVFASVVLRTGYKFRSKNAALAARPMATTVKLRTMVIISKVELMMKIYGKRKGRKKGE
jgi:hypothetical protein